MGTVTTATPSATSVGVPPRAVAVIGACQGCGACLLTCPEHAIRPLGGTLLVFAERCSGCGECVEVCPVDAIDLLVVECGVIGGAL
jgi:Pyruvate/2-oxoacid:ferredoxin oxidoreductase delta subunit